MVLEEAMRDLSILIPSRNEMFLKNTVDDILSNIEADTEIIVVLDGKWPDPGIPDHPRLNLIYHHQSIGQRAATNEAAKMSTAKYVMKCDAHCAFDKGFDAKLLQNIEPDWTVIPRMYNLHAFDWLCKCGERRYQGPKPERCEKCGGNQIDIDLIWKPRIKRMTDFTRFDKDLRFQYWGNYDKRPEAQGQIADVMGCLGACWMMERKRYWDLEGLDEKHGSWGQMGVEIACKSWLSGGRMVVNKNTWFSHMFRTQPGFGFPYEISDKQQEEARKYSRDLWLNDKWEKQTRPLSWLIQKFSPVPDWEPVTKGALYYTCNTHDENIEQACRKQLKSAIGDMELTTVSLKPIDFGNNIVIDRARGAETMHHQIVAGLEKATTDIVFLCESDVLYHPSHFAFVPPRKDVFYYNEHTYRVNAQTEQVVFYYTKQISGCCAYRDLLLEFFRKRLEIIQKTGFNRHYEPGQKTTNEGVFPVSRGGKYGSARWMSELPNLDIRHDKNITISKWKPEDFRNPKACEGWKTVEEVPGWGQITGKFATLLSTILQKEQNQ